MQVDIAGSIEDPVLCFGLDTVLSGLRTAIRHRKPSAFWQGVESFETKYHEPYKEATRNQLDKIFDDPKLRGNVLIQQSSPIAHSMANMLHAGRSLGLVKPEFLDKAMDWLAGDVADLFNYIPVDIPRTGHNCNTNLNGTAPWKPNPQKSWPMEASTDFTNRYLAKTEADHWPEAVHNAMTTNNRPVSLDMRFWAPLTEWNPRVRFIAGMVTREQGVDYHLKATELADRMTGQNVGIGHGCGLGRQREEILGPEAHDAVDRELRLLHRVVQAAN
jgi:hypothetical protein